MGDKPGELRGSSENRCELIGMELQVKYYFW
jgi:hypothetical protein